MQPAQERSVAEDAAALDAEGRHDDAVNLLARAAGAGDAAARRLVGARILVGDRAPLLPAQGASLLEEAAQAGDAEAARILAVFAGAGFFRRRSLEEALDWLTLAAERGSTQARGELGTLCSKQGGDDEGRAADWRRLRAGIDAQALIRLPEGEQLCKGPVILAFPDLADAGACAWLIGRAREKLVRAQVYDGRSADEINETRTNSIRVFGLLETDLVQIVLQHRMAAAVGMPFEHMEALSVLHYAEGQQITEHYDFIDPKSPDYEAQVARDGQRVVTFLVYLNDDYDDGETSFPRLGLSRKGRRGEGLVFTNALPSGLADVRSLHAGRPPKRGEKWIVSQFIRDRPFTPRI